MSKNTQSEHRLLLRPNPVKAPDVPVRTKSGSNPKFYGWSLYAAAILLEWLGFLRKLVWKNAGFASLRDLRGYIENVEPRFDPTVVPTSTHENASIRIQDDEVSSVISRKSSVGDYRALYLSGELTPLDIVRAILPLIRRDTSPPGEHSVAWTEVQVELILDAAKASTLRYKAGKSLGALDGVPAAVKDEFGLRGYKTTFGSAINYASGDAENEGDTSWFVENLEKTGAILMGKVNMHEHGLDTSGNNITFGTPRNPYNSDYYTGGSSSGSAYAIASGLVPIALGSDAGGSIRIPASFCSIYGLKPTHGRLSIHPSPSHSKSCTVYGPMAIDMGSLATLYATICQPHPSSTFASLSNSPPTSSPLYRNPRTKLLGIPEHWLHQATPSIQNLCHATIQKLISEKGYTAIPIHIPFLHEGQIAHAMTVLTDAAVALPNTRDLSPANRVLLAVGGTTPASDYILAQKLRHVMMRHLAWLWEQYPGMLVVSPTTACAGWPIRTEQETVSGISDGDATMQSMKFVWLGNFCGCPGISVPVGFVVPEGRRDGGEIAGVETQGAVPVGMMAMGEWGTEEQLIGFGMDVEDLNGGLQRKPGSWVDVIGIAGRLKGDGVASS